MVTANLPGRVVMLIAGLAALVPPAASAQSLSSEDQKIVDAALSRMANVFVDNMKQNSPYSAAITKSEAPFTACFRDRFMSGISGSQKGDILALATGKTKSAPPWLEGAFTAGLNDCANKLKLKPSDSIPLSSTESPGPYIKCVYPLMMPVEGEKPVLTLYFRSVVVRNGQLLPRTGSLLGDTFLETAAVKSVADNSILKSAKHHEESLDLIYDDGKTLTRSILHATGVFTFTRAYNDIKFVVAAPDGTVIADRHTGGSATIQGQAFIFDRATTERLGNAFTMSIYADGTLARQDTYSLAALGPPRTVEAISPILHNKAFAYKSSVLDAARASRIFNTVIACQIVPDVLIEKSSRRVGLEVAAALLSDGEYYSGYKLDMDWMLKSFPDLF